MLAEPKNGLILHKNIEAALDIGLIAIIPVATAQEPQTRWKMILIDASKANNAALGVSPHIVYWKDPDGKELQFRGKKRLARRYLYFRYIMTYLICQQRGLSMDWARKADTTKGVMWATPGPYLQLNDLRP